MSEVPSDTPKRVENPSRRRFLKKVAKGVVAVGGLAVATQAGLSILFPQGLLPRLPILLRQSLLDPKFYRKTRLQKRN